MSTLGLGVIGNCAIARLIDRSDRHVWHGLGRPDGDMEAVVAGGKAGRQRYLPNTAIPETTVDGRTGALRIVDVAPRFRRFGRTFRPPMPVRRPEPVTGRPRVARRLRPTFNYGGLKPRVASGSHHARFVRDAAVLRLTTDALELFNNVRGRCNHVGLLSEDIDPKTGELWGDFPQTYSQVGLILSAMRLSRTSEEGLWHAS